MFSKTSKRKAFMMSLTLSFIGVVFWYAVRNTPNGALICAGPFLFWGAVYGLVFLMKWNRDKRLADESADVQTPSVTNRAYQQTTGRQFYVPSDDE